jgi:hypothetical protein
METTFELSDTLYAKGIVDEIDEVYIWLGVRWFFFLSSLFILPLSFPLA